VTRVGDEAAARGAPLPRVPGGFAAVVSTHALLHGTQAEIAAHLVRVAESLEPGGLFYAVFASTRDRRFGRGRRIARYTFAAEGGDEAGVAHTFFTRSRLRALLGKRFTLESLEERDAGDVAGRWAHPSAPLTGAVHWFAVASKS